MRELTLEDLRSDIDLIVASAESDLDARDDQSVAEVKEILETLLMRVRVAAGFEVPDEYEDNLPRVTSAMVGSIDDCRIKAEHFSRMCGKPQAHQ